MSKTLAPLVDSFFIHIYSPIITLILSPLTGVTGCKCSAAILIVLSSSLRNTEHIPISWKI